MMIRLLSLFPLLGIVGVLAQNTTGLSPKQYLYLPLGAIKPSGWLYDQLMVQTNGLAGNERNFYDYVAQSDWTGGNYTYSNLEEAGSYWFNGLVPNGVIVNDTTIQSQTQYFLDYVFANQDSTGWIGPEVFDSTKPRYLWGRYPFLFGVIQMIEYNSTLSETLIPAIYKLYDFYPNGNENLLINTMEMLRNSGVSWQDVFDKQYFPTTATENLVNPFNNTLTWHGVNVAEGLKATAVQYRFTHNQSDLERASSGWDLLFEYHGRPSGIFAADEYLAGLQAIRGTELCDVVETMYSGSYLFQMIGDTKFADRVERIAYNSLPATLTGNMWSRQYLQQQNQVAAMNMNPDPFPTDGAYSNVFGLEPNYPCCTVNHPQGWPKFVTNSFVTTPDQSSLVHVYLGPLNTSTTLANNNAVTVNVDTLYPFSDTLTTTITATSAFTYYVRIPSWVSGGTIAINGGAAQAVNPSNGLQSVSIGAGTTTIVLNVPAEITLENRPESSIAVHRGPLHYAFDISRNQTILAQNAQQPLAVDLQYLATEAWQYAIDPSTLTFNSNPPSSGELPSPIFDAGLPPLTITVTACPVAWGLAGDTFADSPPVSPSCTGAPTNITLWPFGATKLRIGEFPVFNSTQ
ncbi:hypothetical protein SERLADRAFT_441925 [Serpula lacrymans var. lacrymans S7.9]|uniref:Uncharacterized protein n=1 Tax=Serpula lacrymans var. lacrymans (strain S7.9) TaxID=578457 RepID=F8P822_SERL9|nr:uncharacterized protein SERLADRAFT_441925 [Serpula lacrymans var. lacrymans S7.9]EGO20580.1 hypothetical protein SERLADRAFT_441925 [Serpula lacrymans var. lacrymans S7.9]